MQPRVTSVGLLIKPNPADSFEYPHHIDRASLDALPSRPGIYIFRDDKDRPLYIGKSINIRTRVLSHLRTPEEARMLQQSSYIEFRRTAGDIGALLLESRLIKELQPLHNKKLRRTREMCTLRLGPSIKSIPEIVYARDHDFARTADLYGLFATRRAAQDKLREIVEMQMLCPALTGLETAVHGRACFARQISRCLGACIGAEPMQEHYRRLKVALNDMRILVWPYEGAMGIVEECDGWKQTHVVDHWSYLGSIDHAPGTPPVKRAAKRAFDVDTYKILVKPMLRGELRIEAVDI
ncbi:GIY-YIG nuclease family protein [Noviherbaspirillum sp. Root189]|uniref:GIY-YIG nuclease family protein n=1 Tax=Noviherbaspirillum sp. Root189 TaxID=1736487 RepID=UPI00070F468E|nr:GIY-YIG nuclease family protein [Noviherbaspirillum sp. Root189]KRB93295.1 endonuclease [Noviherbaspirillum sp. Root189]